MSETYSILMTVYYGEKPETFRQAIASAMNQSIKSNDFVVVCDGPLTEQLDAVLNEFQSADPDLFQIIRLPENKGVGTASNVGVKYCKNELIAKMDADDISFPERCERQIQRFMKKPELAVLGGQILEFVSEPSQPCSRRVVPCDNEAIRRFGRKRQPFNNPSVMYRKSVIQQVGGIRPYFRGEDYDLYVRILHAGYYCENLDENLVWVRIAENREDRRVSFHTYRCFVQTRWNALRLGYSSWWDFLIACAAETVVCLCPPSIQNYIYRTILHKSIETDQKEGAADTTFQQTGDNEYANRKVAIASAGDVENSGGD